jgi:RNA polymerase sigma factor (sigma-70 family)
MRLNQYEILDPIALGALRRVWRGRDTTLDREVAIKVLPPDVAADPDRLKRFRNEARVLATMNHPAILAIYDLLEQNGQYFLVMEVVSGETLAHRLARGPLGFEETRRVALGIVAGLEAVHGSGLVHCDLKPANIHLTVEGTVKILDFGLAKVLGPADVSAGDPTEAPPDSTLEASRDTMAGDIWGTPMYMSPEQWRGEPIDHRADIWAFGCVLYQMLTRNAPFKGKTVPELRASILTAGPDWAALRPYAPKAIVTLVRRCLKRDRRRRLQSMGDARIDLERAKSAELGTVGKTESRSPAPIVPLDLFQGHEELQELPMASTMEILPPMASTMEILPNLRPETAAPEKLIARYLPALRRWASERLPASERSFVDIDDLVQNVLLRSLHHTEKTGFRHDGAFLVYMRQILMNVIHDQVRRARRTPEMDLLPDETSAETTRSLQEHLIGRGEVEAYEAALARLPEKMREAVVLRMEMGLTYAQVADALGGPSPNAARMLVSRALVRLAEEMQGQGRDE